ncbi:ice-binding family protein [Streptomyces sp. NBC_01565]|uniref:ice-binding family protein n=1 Tax=Streptomyces sp. NBC_01565 TaxID=2975881 RepID=UPI0022516283|nr:ice-binding family protein [Streptomyces sp. NBC_01565]MCX4539204.1 ice-binding family protein [Streptomyces sp. NBC_01565]
MVVARLPASRRTTERRPPGTRPCGPAAQQAQSDLTVAYNDAAGRGPGADPGADLTGQILTPGVYTRPASTSLGLTGTVTLDGQNDPNSVFIFQIPTTLITEVGSNVQLVSDAGQHHRHEGGPPGPSGPTGWTPRRSRPPRRSRGS